MLLFRFSKPLSSVIVLFLTIIVVNLSMIPKASGGISDESMTLGARQEFATAMNHLFDTKIAPLLKDVDLVMQFNQTAKQSRLNQVNELIKVVDKVVSHINQIVQGAIQKFDQANDKTIAKIKDDVITDSATQLDNLRDNFRKDVDNFFYQTENIINPIDCKVESKIEPLYVKMETFRKDVAALIPSRWFFWREPHYCYKIMKIKPEPQSFDYATIYELKKCELLMSLKPETPIKRVQSVYLDLKALAATMMCMQFHAGEYAKRYYTWDWLEFDGQYDFWDKLCPSPCNIPAKIPEESLSN
jgi:hypothetical protein